MTHDTEKRMAELYAQDIDPALAAEIIAKENGFDNVSLADAEDVEYVGEHLVALIGVVWLDICGDEKPALALLDMDVDKRVDIDEPQEFANALCAIDWDTRKLNEFATLFVY